MRQWHRRVPFRLRRANFFAFVGREAYTSVPSMGRILLEEGSQSEPMTATVVKRKT